LRPRAGLEAEQGRDEERVISELDDPGLAVVIQPGHAQPGRFDGWPVSRVQPVVAEEVLNNGFCAVHIGGSRPGQQPNGGRASGERARQWRHDKLISVRARLGMLGAGNAKDVACVLDQYVLEAASSAGEWNAALARGRDRGQGPVHALVRTRWCDPQTRILALQLGAAWHPIGGDPLPFSARMAEAVIQAPVRHVLWRVVADDADHDADDSQGGHSN